MDALGQTRRDIKVMEGLAYAVEDGDGRALGSSVADSLRSSKFETSVF